MKLTIKDIAKIAGVSPATVSRVINKKNKGYMKKETEQKVLRIIKEFGYVPDARAKALRGLKTHLIGVIVPEALSCAYQEFIGTIVNVCYERGYGTLICSSENNAKRELAYVRILESQRVDGIIIISERLKAQAVNDSINKGIPIVLVDEDIPGAEAPTVVTDYYEGALQATQYLIDLGHKRIAFVKGRPTTPSSQERFRGYIEALRRNSLDVEDRLIKAGDFTYKSGYEATETFLKESPDDLTAIFCSSDLMAFGAIRCIQERGKNVPTDYSVIGFDDIYFSAINNPSLTTVDVPFRKLTEIAIDIIKNWTEKGKEKRSICEAKLVIRHSCAKMVK